MLFSKRNGLVPKEKLQLESMNDDLRVSIWNCLVEHSYDSGFNHYSLGRQVLKMIWMDVLNKPVDRMGNNRDSILSMRELVFQGEWFVVYDIVEVVVRAEREFFDKASTACCINDSLGRHNSGYRLVNGMIAPITSGKDFEEIERALSSTNRYAGARQHIQSALELFCERELPDYRNSIKESISAVESLAIQLTEDKKGTLGQLLDKMQSSHGLHPALAKGFSSIYGWTSNEGGIRHAMIEEPNVTVADARFMLVACSAFINYVVDKTNTSPQES